MYHPFSGEHYDAMPDGTVRVRTRHGHEGRVRLSADGTSYEVVSGDVPRATVALIQRALEIGVEEGNAV